VQPIEYFAGKIFAIYILAGSNWIEIPQTVDFRELSEFDPYFF